jgi:23S rRNA (uracil1939-C5)-methyltransferase
MIDTPIKRGTIIDLFIDSLAFGGKGVARVDDFVIFVDSALPGQLVRVEVRKCKKNFAEAKIVKIIKQSPHYVKPVCAHFGECGGCLLQNFDYQTQLIQKRDQVVDSLKRLGRLDLAVVEPTMPSPDIYFYRNKMEFSFSRQRWLSDYEMNSKEVFEQDGVFLGLHPKGFYEKVIDVQKCHLLSEHSNQIVNTVRNFARKSGLPAYSTRNHRGFWRFLVIREGKNTGNVMVNIITAWYELEVIRCLAKELQAVHSQITSLVNNISSKKAAAAFGEEEVLLSGHPSIRERIGKHEFEISANSFFQTNTKQAENLYEIILEYAQLNGDELIFDLYSGSSTIGIHIAEYAREVVGFEVIPSSIDDAHCNLKINNINNLHCVAGDLRDLQITVESLIHDKGRPDMVIIDPPRAGMHPKTVEAVIELHPKRIVHVSCNPTTLARDLSLLCETDYQITKVQPVDMFPHTAHIEVVVQLIKK